MSTLERMEGYLANPDTVALGPFMVKYHYICLPQNAIKTPLVVLGNSFLDNGTVLKLITKFIADFPVYYINLPGFGSNLQVSTFLEYSDYAVMLKEFMDSLGINRANVLGLSESSYIAYTFASLFKDRIGRLVLGGITHKLRPTTRFLLEESHHSLKTFKNREFSAGLAYTLVNLAGGEFTLSGDKDNYISLYRRLQELNSKERESFNFSLERLRSLNSLSRPPKCDILFINGEQDHFITPFEAHKIKLNCKGSQFAMIKDMDHMLGASGLKHIPSLVERFLKGAKLPTSESISLITSNQFPREKIRQSDRYGVDWSGQLSCENTKSVNTQILDFNFHGCKMKAQMGAREFDQAKYHLKLPTLDMGLDLVLFRGLEEDLLRGVFLVKDVSQLVKIKESLGPKKGLSKVYLAA